MQVVREGEYCTLFSTDSKRLHAKLFANHLALLTNVRVLDFFFFSFAFNGETIQINANRSKNK